MIELDYQLLDKELDKVKTRTFLGNNASFLGPLACSVNFLWTEDIKTAQTNGICLYWNPNWFTKLPFDTRITVILHELWHLALLHVLRRGTRDPKIWNIACDIYINNMLKSQGYSFKGTIPWIDPKYSNHSVEEIYDDLYSLPDLSGYGDFLWGYTEPDEDGELVGDTTDILEPENENSTAQHVIINKVVQAATAAKLAGNKDNGVPEEVETMLKQFLQPKLPWELLLNQFFQALYGLDYSLARPNRRYRDVYLPSLTKTNNGLIHIIYYLDVSGSVPDGHVVRFNSEIKYIKETFNPDRLTLVLFDDKIQKVYEFYENDEFDKVVIVGRGGTDLAPVREHMLKHRPTAAVIFSDLYCSPMEPLPPGVTIPTIWVAVNASSTAKVPFGKLIHIQE